MNKAVKISEPKRNGLLDFENPLSLEPSVIAQMRESAVRTFPHEMCGLVVKGQWVEAENISKDPKTSWMIDQNFQSEFNPEDVQGVVHSHCKPYRIEPTKTDMEFQIQDGNPWGIIHADEKWASKPLWWGDFRLDEPLIGRTFMHGVKDCYSAIRSWYWQNRQILLPEVARNVDWWLNFAEEGSLYAEGMKEHATRISRDEVQPGDGALFQFLARVPHHAAVITDRGQMYHHLEDNLSGETPLGNYQKFAVAWLRYKPNPKEVIWLTHI